MKRILILTIVITAMVAPSVQADIVYDNSANQTGYFYKPNGLETGDEIILAGTARELTKITIHLYSHFDGSADLQARIYENDGAGGDPGTVLYDSGILDDVGYIDGYNSYSFAVPNVLVPDTLTWTIHITDDATAELGLLINDPPTVGSSYDDFWQYDGGWSMYWFGGDPVANFGAKLGAVPAPGAALLAVIGFGLVGWLRRFFS